MGSSTGSGLHSQPGPKHSSCQGNHSSLPTCCVPQPGLCKKHHCKNQVCGVQDSHLLCRHRRTSLHLPLQQRRAFTSAPAELPPTPGCCCASVPPFWSCMQSFLSSKGRKDSVIIKQVGNHPEKEQEKERWFYSSWRVLHYTETIVYFIQVTRVTVDHRLQHSYHQHRDTALG